MTARIVSPTIRSNWCPVACTANSTQRCSSSGVATRQIARTRENDNSPRPNASLTRRSTSSCRATATCWRAVTGLIPTCKPSHCAADTHSHSSYPFRRSYSPTCNSQWHVAAARCPAHVVISASNRSVAIPANIAGSIPTPATLRVVPIRPWSPRGMTTAPVGCRPRFHEECATVQAELPEPTSVISDRVH